MNYVRNLEITKRNIKHTPHDLSRTDTFVMQQLRIVQVMALGMQRTVQDQVKDNRSILRLTSKHLKRRGCLQGHSHPCRQHYLTSWIIHGLHLGQLRKLSKWSTETGNGRRLESWDVLVAVAIIGHEPFLYCKLGWFLCDQPWTG